MKFKKLLSAVAATAIAASAFAGMAVTASADTTVYSVSLDNGATQTPATSNFFNVSSGGGYNSKYTGTYNSHNYAKGLKMNSSSSIAFTTTESSTVTIVQSTTSNSDKKFKFNSASVTHSATGSITVNADTIGYTMTENTTDKYKKFVFTSVPAGNNTITNDGETGILYVSVEYADESGSGGDDPIVQPSITLDQASLSLDLNETKTGTLTATTENTVTWSSSDTDVATVAGGVVTAVGVGTATITATDDITKDTATCTVTVVDTTPAAEPTLKSVSSVTTWTGSSFTEHSGKKFTNTYYYTTDEDLKLLSTNKEIRIDANQIRLANQTTTITFKPAVDGTVYVTASSNETAQNITIGSGAAKEIGTASTTVFDSVSAGNEVSIVPESNSSTHYLYIYEIKFVPTTVGKGFTITPATSGNKLYFTNSAGQHATYDLETNMAAGSPFTVFVGGLGDIDIVSVELQ